jgi:hypothetical protein
MQEAWTSRAIYRSSIAEPTLIAGVHVRGVVKLAGNPGKPNPLQDASVLGGAQMITKRLGQVKY